MAITRLNYGSSFTNLVKSDSFLDGNSAYIPSSFESIATITATGGETSLTFSSIPSTYASLQVRGISRRNAAGGHWVAVRFNSDTGTNYSHHMLRGTATAGVQVAGEVSQSYLICFDAASTSAGSNIFGAGIIDIQDYASTTKNKTVRAIGGYDDNGTTNSLIGLNSGAWLSTSAVTSVTLYFGGDALAAGSTFALYGQLGA